MLDLLANTGLGSCIILVLGLAAMWVGTAPTKKKPGVTAPGQDNSDWSPNV